jgi:hypothetical protein
MKKDSETEKPYSDGVEELYLALEKVLECMSQSSKPQRKLADEIGTLLVNHYEVYGRRREERKGSVEIDVELDKR